MPGLIRFRDRLIRFLPRLSQAAGQDSLPRPVVHQQGPGRASTYHRLAVVLPHPFQALNGRAEHIPAGRLGTGHCCQHGSHFPQQQRPDGRHGSAQVIVQRWPASPEVSGFLAELRQQLPRRPDQRAGASHLLLQPVGNLVDHPPDVGIRGGHPAKGQPSRLHPRQRSGARRLPPETARARPGVAERCGQPIPLSAGMP